MQQKYLRVGVCTTFLAAFVMMFAAFASGASEQILYTFTGGTDGSEPTSGLTFDHAGNLYGITFFGGSGQGVVYKLSRTSSGWQQTVVHTFQGGSTDGANPNANLLIDSAGNIYGTTIGGGASNAGVAFELTPSLGGWTETLLFSFASGSGTPSSGLIMDHAGNLYGETSGGGKSGNGTVYILKHTATGWSHGILHSFAGGSDGIFPSGGLIFDRTGNLYGTTISGGSFANVGTVFELMRGTTGVTEAILYTFQGGADGVNPQAPVIFDSAGNLYGTVSSGGDMSCGGGFGCGAVFELSPSSSGPWTKTVLHNFTDNPDGHAPLAGLTFNSAGHLFGTTINGGTSGTGALFELMQQSGVWTESVVYSFTNGSDGGFPVTPVTIAPNGVIYGTAQFGGQGFGVAFAFTGVSSQ